MGVGEGWEAPVTSLSRPPTATEWKEEEGKEEEEENLPQRGGKDEEEEAEWCDDGHSSSSSRPKDTWEGFKVVGRAKRTEGFSRSDPINNGPSVRPSVVKKRTELVGWPAEEKSIRTLRL